MKRAIHQLAALRRSFDPAATKLKAALLAAARREPLNSLGSLRQYHDELLYQCAYPDTPAVLRAAESELRRVARVTAAADKRTFASLADSGIAGTSVAHSFSLDLLRWLTDRFGNRVELIWKDDSLGDAFDEVLPLLIAPAEIDGTLSQRLSVREWLRKAMGRAPGGEIAWLVRQFERLAARREIRDRVFDTLNLNVRWPLAAASRTFTRFPPRPIFHQREELIRRVDLPQILATPLPRSRPLPAKRATELIDIARATLAVRCRETDPVTYANPREVTLFQLDRGVDVALFGMLPQRRQPIESFFGFVAARNRVPIAYGGGWVFFDRCEIGVNLFEEFRGGESAFIFAQVLRVYAQHYRAKQFLVDPFQFGADNDEAIRSGAFWFYYRLGFRPTEPPLRKLADSQAARIQSDPIYRSPPRILARLAKSYLFLDVDTNAPHREPAKRFIPIAPDLVELSAALTAWIGRRFKGDRTAAGVWSERHVVRTLQIRSQRAWPIDESLWFARLTPLIAMIPDLNRWPAAERHELTRVMRMKGSPQERDHALGCAEAVAAARGA